MGLTGDGARRRFQLVLNNMNNEIRSQFVESWGALSHLLGVSPSVARIHAYLMASDDPVPFDEIVEALQVSRGNASMSLKELRSWGVVRRSRNPGDRRDYYASEDDVWKMFFTILAQRKTRELDPAVREVRALLESEGATGDGPAAARLAQTRDLLVTVNLVMGRVLGHEKQSRLLMGLLARLSSEE